MIADDEQEFHELFEAYFSLRPEFDLVRFASDGTEALAAALELKPDVLLCDCNMPGLNGLEVTSELSKQLPECIVIILSGNDYDEFSKKAMLAGARDYVSKPVELETIARKIIEVQTKALEVRAKASSRKTAAGRAAKLFAFYSPKGSAGSTSLAVNAALELARGRQRVLLIDLNLQFGDVEFLLDLKARACISALVGDEGALVPARLGSTAEVHESGLHVLYQHTLEESELVTPALMGALLTYVKSSTEYDFVVLDLARQLDERTLSAIDAADALFLVVTEDYLAVKNAKLCVELFRKLGYTENKLRILVNKVGPTPAGHVATHLGPPFATFSLQTKLFEQSVKSGFPPIIEHPTNPFSQSVSNLVSSAMLLRKESDEAPAETGADIGGLFKKLFS